MKKRRKNRSIRLKNDVDLVLCVSVGAVGFPNDTAFLLVLGVILLQNLREEMYTVLLHEFAHIKNNDFAKKYRWLDNRLQSNFTLFSLFACYFASAYELKKNIVSSLFFCFERAGFFGQYLRIF